MRLLTQLGQAARFSANGALFQTGERMNVSAWYAALIHPVGPPRNRHLVFELLESRLALSAMSLGQAFVVPPSPTPAGAAVVGAPQKSATTPFVDPQLQALYEGALADPSRLLFDASGRVGVAVAGQDMTALLPKLESFGFQSASNPTPPWAGPVYDGYLPVTSIGQMASLGPDGLTSIDARLAPFVAPPLKQVASGTATDTSQLLFDAQGRVGVSVFGYDMQTLSAKLQAVGFQPLANPNDPWFGPGVSGYLPIDAIDQVASWADDGLLMFTARNAANVDPNLSKLAAGETPNSDQLMFDSAGRVAVSVMAYDQHELDPVLASLGFVALPNPTLPNVPGENGYIPVAALKQVNLLADDGLFMLVARYRAYVDRALSELADGQTANASGLVFDSSGRVGVYIQAAEFGRLLPVLEQVGFVPGDSDVRAFPGVPGFLPVSALNDIEMLTDNGLIGIVAQQTATGLSPRAPTSAAPASGAVNEASVAAAVALSPTLVHDEPALPPVATIAPATTSQSGPPILAGPATSVAKTGGSGLTTERDGD